MKMRMKLCRKKSPARLSVPMTPQCLGTAAASPVVGTGRFGSFLLNGQNFIGYFLSSTLKSAFLYVSFDSRMSLSPSR